MDSKSLVKFLWMLGIVPETQIDNWLQVKCPTYYLHESGQDTRPSCGISVNDEGMSVVNCFVCGTRSLGSLLVALIYKQDISKEVLDFYVRHEIIKEADKPSFSFQSSNIKTEWGQNVPDEVLSFFTKIKDADSNTRDFLKQRGIDPDICDNLLSYRDGIVWPIKDIDKKTYWLHYRGISQKSFRYIKPYEFNLNIEWGKKDTWYGLEEADFDAPLIIVEGEMDRDRLKTLGIKNVLAAHGGVGRKSAKLFRLKSARKVILGFDADKAGQVFQERTKEVLKNTEALDWAKVGCKDAGELKSRKDFDKVWDARMGRKMFAFI